MWPSKGVIGQVREMGGRVRERVNQVREMGGQSEGDGWAE
jgi:hypothetical protein